MQKFFLIALSLSWSLWAQDSISDIPELIAPAGVPEETGKFMGEFIKVMAAVGVMVVALLFLSWSTRKMMNVKIQQANETSALKILEKRVISPKTTLYQLEFEGRSVLMAESTNGVTLLQTIPKRESFNLKEVNE